MKDLLPLLLRALHARPAVPPSPRRRRRRALPAAQPVADPAGAAVGAATADAEADADPGCRCGWFDSSHALQRGLVVTEFEQPEAVARLVPLGWWLDWHGGAARSPERRRGAPIAVGLQPHPQPEPAP